MTGVKTTKTDPCVGGGRVLEALIWPCGFSKRQAFIQAVDGFSLFKASSLYLPIQKFTVRQGYNYLNIIYCKYYINIID